MTLPLAHPGVAWYLGRTGSGKSTLASAHGRELARTAGVPLVVVDTTEDRLFADLPLVRPGRDLARMAWRSRRSCRIVPRSPLELDQVARQAGGGKDVVLLVDDVGWWIDAQRRSGAVLSLLRVHRHSRVSVLLTTQHLSGDVPQVALECSAWLFVGQVRSPRSLARLREMGLDPSKVPALNPFQAMAFRL